MIGIQNIILLLVVITGAAEIADGERSCFDKKPESVCTSWKDRGYCDPTSPYYTRAMHYCCETCTDSTQDLVSADAVSRGSIARKKEKEIKCCEKRAEALRIQGKGRVGVFVPTCNPDCSYAAKQCWGSTGYCWCSDPSGKAIAGTRARGFVYCDYWSGPQIKQYVQKGLQWLKAILEKREDVVNKSLSTEVKEVAEKVSVMFDPSKYFYYPENTTDHIAKYYYPIVRARFVGFGWPLHHNGTRVSNKKTLYGCILQCKSDGATWDGVVFFPTVVFYHYWSCWCMKKAIGEEPPYIDASLYYHFV